MVGSLVKRFRSQSSIAIPLPPKPGLRQTCRSSAAHTTPASYVFETAHSAASEATGRLRTAGVFFARPLVGSRWTAVQGPLAQKTPTLLGSYVVGAATASGSVNEKVLPCPLPALSTQIFPPCAVTISLQIERPRPCPATASAVPPTR